MPTPKGFRRRHNTRRARQRASFRAAQSRHEGRCQLLRADGKRCPNPAVKAGYCKTCWGSNG